MTEILLIGGTRFFGRHIRDALLNDGHTVTLLTRGNRPAIVDHPRLQTITADRKDAQQLAAALEGRSFDTVIDNVCYEPTDARAVTALLRGRCQRYVLTSTVMTYLNGAVTGDALRESDWSAQQGTDRMGVQYGPQELTYAVNKRACEEVVLAATDIHPTVLRLHNVVGIDDFSGKSGAVIAPLIKDGTVTLKGCPDDTYQLVLAQDVGHLYALIAARPAGSLAPAYNVAAPPIRLADYAALITDALGFAPNRIGFAETGTTAPFPLNVRLDSTAVLEAFGADLLTPCERFIPEMSRWYADKATL